MAATKQATKRAPAKRSPKPKSAGTKAEALSAYCDRKAEGKGNPEALAAAKAVTEIGHAICGLAWYADPRNPEFTKVIPELKGAPEAMLAEATVALRGGAGWKGHYQGTELSWGRICIAVGLYTPGDLKSPEGRVRRLFEEGTGRQVVSQGTRIGRGGRWLSNDPTLYPGNHKAIGVESPKPRQEDRKALAEKANTYDSRVKALAAKKAAAAKRVRKASK